MPRNIPLADFDAGYMRVSSVDVDEYDGDRDRAIAVLVEKRAKELQDAVAKTGKVVPDELLFSDMDISGTKIASRPGMTALIAAARRGEFSRLWFRNIARTFRNLEEQIATLKTLEALGIKIVSLQEPSPDEKHLADLMWNMLGAVNQYLAGNTGSQIKANNRLVASMGRLPTGRAPMGYVYSKETKAMSIDPVRAPYVVQIFQAYIRVCTFSGVAQELNAAGMLTPHGSLWTHKKIADVLTNPVYRGFVHYAGEQFPGKHELIVPEVIIAQVDALLAANARAQDSHGNRSADKQHTYSRLLLCGLCGSGLRSQPNRWGTTVYHCRVRVGAADMRSVKQDGG